MQYKGPGGFGRVVNILMNIFMCSVFSFVMLYIMQQRFGDQVQILTPVAFIISFITAFGIGYASGDLIPTWGIGSAVSQKLGLSGAPAYFVTVAVVDVIMTILISFFMTMINTIEHAGFVGGFMMWLEMLPLMLLIGYIVQLVVMKPIMSFATKVTGFDPNNPHAAEH